MTYRLELILDSEHRWIAEYPLSQYDINKARKWGNYKSLYKVVQNTIAEGLIASTNEMPRIKAGVQLHMHHRARGTTVAYPNRYYFIDGSILETSYTFELTVHPPTLDTK